jgi:hypothetical protein
MVEAGKTMAAESWGLCFATVISLSGREGSADFAPAQAGVPPGWPALGDGIGILGWLAVRCAKFAPGIGDS